MPTAKSLDDTPLTGDKVSTLQYVEARLHALQELTEARQTDADLRYAQRFSASQEALNAAMLAADRAIQAALLSQKEAVIKAEIANEKRFESVNEFRKTLSDQTSSFIPRAEAAARFDNLSEKMDALNSRMDKAEGSGTGLKAGWGYLVGAVAATAALVGLFFTLTAKIH